MKSMFQTQVDLVRLPVKSLLWRWWSALYCEVESDEVGQATCGAFGPGGLAFVQDKAVVTKGA